MNKYIEEVSKVVQKASLPTVLGVRLANHNNSSSHFINAVWKQTNYEISKARQFITSFKFDVENGLENIPTFPIQYDAGILEKISLSKMFRACIKKQENASTKKEEFILEVSSETQIIQTINLSSFDKHGPIHADPYFGGLQWSEDESSVIYVAEKKKTKNSGFFDRQPAAGEKKGDEEKEEKDDKTFGEKYNYEESWGEMLSEITNTCLVIVNLKDETVKTVAGVPDNICPAQPQWVGPNSLLFTGYNIKPYRLGLRVCECRPSKIYILTLGDDEKKIEELCPDKSNVSDHSSRINSAKENIVFIRRELSQTGNLHRGNELLMLYNIKDHSTRELYGVDESLFSHDLPNNCWFSDNLHVAVPNDNNGVTHAMIINTQTREIVSKIECNGLYNVDSDLLLMISHELDSAGATLKVGYFKDGKVHLHEQPTKKDELIEYGQFNDEHGVVSYYMLPTKSTGPFPLVVIPHGGPHVMCGNGFRKSAAVFVKLGYAVLLCNYRGSTGFSKDILNALAGNVGDIDIKDVQNMVSIFLKQQGNSINQKQIFVCGGSHGGFIGAHLVGQFPEFYCAAALLNPVIDIAAMSAVTDIPDWCYVGGGEPYSQDKIPSSETYTKMLQKSPIVYLKKIKAPILLCIGGKDLRVPPSQGKNYYRLLQANNKKAKLLYYPEDSHPLGSIETDGDVTVNICKWFHIHKRE